MPVRIDPKSAHSVSDRTDSLFMFRYNILKNVCVDGFGVMRAGMRKLVLCPRND